MARNQPNGCNIAQALSKRQAWRLWYLLGYGGICMSHIFVSGTNASQNFLRRHHMAKASAALMMSAGDEIRHGAVVA